MLFASCDIVVDLDIPEHERVLVVNSILTTDSMINASISHSVGAFDASSISYVNNATVEVYEDGVLLGEMDEQASLSYDSSGELDSTYVYNFNQNPVAGKIYSYEIVHPDYEAVRAETTVPAEVKLNVNDVTLLSEQDYEKHFRVRFSFNDAREDNFYRLRLRNPNTYYGFAYFESNDASMISSAGVQSDGATFYGDEALFDDGMFNGTEKEISIDFFDSKSLWFEEEGIEVQFILELTSVSESYYTYIRSLRAHFDNQDQFIFAGEPVQVFTNIENGLGVLGSMSLDTVLLELP
tara:strand:+ start:1751 stop:2635 length:885 start_codon:yes stop_codon:yes gene_type:complete